jgi:hypothetical protein
MGRVRQLSTDQSEGALGEERREVKDERADGVRGTGGEMGAEEEEEDGALMMDGADGQGVQPGSAMIGGTTHKGSAHAGRDASSSTGCQMRTMQRKHCVVRQSAVMRCEVVEVVVTAGECVC